MCCVGGARGRVGVPGLRGAQAGLWAREHFSLTHLLTAPFSSGRSGAVRPHKRRVVVLLIARGVW